MTYADTLCHFTSPGIQSLHDFINPAFNKGISQFGLTGTHPPDWQLQMDLASQFSQCTFFHNFGIHPKWIPEDSNKRLGYLKELEANIHNCHGIGEIGLDYYNLNDISARNLQKEVFNDQVQLALRYKKPVALHIVKAHHHAQEVLSPYKQKNLRGFVHSFIGSQQLADFYLNLGLHISIGPHSLRDPRDTLIQSIPENRLLIESGAPQTVPGSNGLKSNPTYLLEAADLVAKIRNTTKEHVLNLSQKNLNSMYCH